jgi:hypothetical protein
VSGPGRRRLLAALAIALLVATASGAQSRPATLRLASLPQSVVTRYRAGFGGGGALGPELRVALDRGVRDGVVFPTERGVIRRDWLVRKPIRLVPGPEAVGLGGRGDFELVAVRPPAGPAAWTEVDIAPRSGRPDDVLILEIGGELSTISQVLDAIFVLDGGVSELSLSPTALIARTGVPVLNAPFGRPLARPDARGRFHPGGGLAFLVVRSLVEVMVDGASTPHGMADVSPHWAGEWREGDRLLVRIPQATLGAGLPSLLLSWKDRVSLEPIESGR